MQTTNNQSTQPVPPLPTVNLQPVESENRFSFTRSRLIRILIAIIALLLIFGLGVRAVEKRALRKESNLKAQPTPTIVPSTPIPTPFTPTITPLAPTSTPAAEEQPIKEKEGSPPQPKSALDKPISCKDRVDCIDCFIGVCNTGDCINGICVWPTSPPGKSEQVGPSE